jgi:hypothetical protein
MSGGGWLIWRHAPFEIVRVVYFKDDRIYRASRSYHYGNEDHALAHALYDALSSAAGDKSSKPAVQFKAGPRVRDCVYRSITFNFEQKEVTVQFLSGTCLGFVSIDEVLGK